MGTKRMAETDPLLFAKLKAEKRLTQIWYSKISGQLAWKPGEREELAKKSEQAAMDVDHIIGFRELHGSPLLDRLDER